MKSSNDVDETDLRKWIKTSNALSNGTAFQCQLHLTALPSLLNDTQIKTSSIKLIFI